MVTLIQYAPALGLRSGSPFCTKVEALLCLGKVPYETEIWNNPSKAPKGKLPVLRDGDKLIADSYWIRKHLELHHGCDLDGSLGSSERAIADAFTKLCEEHLYWCLLHGRWFDDDNWRHVKEAYFGAIPAIVRPLAVPAIRRATHGQIKGHGMGRHAPDEIVELGMGDIQSLAAFLGTKPYFMGEAATAVDATVYAFVSGLVDCTLPGPIKDEALRHDNLVAYCKRLGEKWFAGS